MSGKPKATKELFLEIHLRDGSTVYARGVIFIVIKHALKLIEWEITHELLFYKKILSNRVIALYHPDFGMIDYDLAIVRFKVVDKIPKGGEVENLRKQLTN